MTEKLKCISEWFPKKIATVAWPEVIIGARAGVKHGKSMGAYIVLYIRPVDMGPNNEMILI